MVDTTKRTNCNCDILLLDCANALFLFFFNDTATTEIYTLSLHDALPISSIFCRFSLPYSQDRRRDMGRDGRNAIQDRKSTRLNSSHPSISYAVFCLKKKKSRSKRRRNHECVHLQRVRAER